MKKLWMYFVVISIACRVLAQSPDKMSYQAVVRNGTDHLVTNHAVGMKISILQGSATGTDIYIETQTPTTNANGLVTIEIGGGDVISGTFSTIDWANGPYFLKTETDPTGGTNYAITGTSQLLSVPYALHAKTAENGFSGNYNDLSNTPILFDGDYNTLNNKPALFGGAYSDLTGTPTTLAGFGITDAMSTSHVANGITSTNISNWNTAYGWGNHAGLYRPVDWVPSWTDVTDKPLLATVAITGRYIDLRDLPPLFDGSWAHITNKPNTVSGYGITDAVTTIGDQTIAGIKTFSNDIKINGLTVGEGKGGMPSNTAIGAGALRNTSGDENTATGYSALNSNTTGYSNTANGIHALSNNTTGSNNTANGASTLVGNLTGKSNTANGANALYFNTTGADNTANGYRALYSNTTGATNTAHGINSLYSNTTGGANTANGSQALYSNTTGGFNTAIGLSALYSNATGNANTAIGWNANVASGDLTNATAIGAGATVNAGNKVVIGNSGVTNIGGYANWTNYSDKRLKENIVNKNDLGLKFINQLQTVSYNYKADSLKHRRDGLIAQDVEKALNDLGLQFSGLVIDDDKDKTMNLSYGDFVIPLINAVQELSKQNNELKDEIGQLKAVIEALKQH